MAFLKGQEVDGSVQIDRDVRFMKAVDLNNTWQDTYYVDPTDGSDTNSGKSPRAPFKSPRVALTSAGAWDTIYVRPKAPDTSGGDPTAITPDTAANWIVPYTSHGLSIIGAGTGRGFPKGYVCMLRGYTGLTTPTIYVKAPYVNLENLGLRGAAACTAGAVKFSFSNAGPDWSFGGTVYNCTFWKAASTYGGALVMDAAWYMSVINSHFISCYTGIYIGASNSVPVGVRIEGCRFQGLTTEVSCDIYGPGSVTNILIDDCHFNHALPAAGAPNLFISFGAASTGLFSNSSIGATSSAVATNTTLNGVGYSNVLCGPNKSFMATA